MTTDRVYKDFDLTIWSDGQDYFGQVLDSPAGPSEVEKLDRPFPQKSRTELRLWLENAVLKGQMKARNGPISAEGQVLKDFGTEMFNIVFRKSRSIASRYAASLALVQTNPVEIEGLRVKLRLRAPELADLPWEYVYDDQDENYLCLRNHSPLVRFMEVSVPEQPLKIDGPLNVLLMVADPRGDWARLDTENERRRMDEALEPLRKRGEVYYRWVPGGTAEALEEVIDEQKWHVFHFIGHGGCDVHAHETAGSDEVSWERHSYVVLEDGAGGVEKIYGDALRNMLEGRRALRLAVLNCCESGRLNGQSVFGSPGAALVRSLVPSVIAMQFPIADDAAIGFAREFYKKLIRGDSVERALTRARVSMHRVGPVAWGIPVLYTRASPQPLFAVAKAPDARRAQPVKSAPGSRLTKAQLELRKLLA